MPDALGGQRGRQAARALQRAGGVLPPALAADQQQAEAGAQPLQMVAAQVLDVVTGAVEVRLVATLAPGVPALRVVVAAEAEREREAVGALEREVGGVEGAHAAARRDDLGRAVLVAVDEGHDALVD